MIANQDTMVKTFWECNKKYFNNSLPTPIFETVNRFDVIGKFECHKNKKSDKKPIRNQIIKMTDCYDFDEKEFIDTMVHEMIHYYIAWNRIKDNGQHGKKFMQIANEMNEKYGLNITKTKDASSYKLSENAPEIVKKKSFFSYFFG
jgi:hypothetical protein